MPIHLPPISRRRFLGQALVAGAALSLPRSLFAADDKPTDLDCWVLLADPHLAADRATVNRGANMAEHFTTFTRELLGLPKRPAGVFINGDCAFNTGEKSDYATLAALLEPLRLAGIPFHLALGNHDSRERFWEAFPAEKAAQRAVADRQVALLRTPRANWFVLDSLEKTASTPGLLGHQQLDWLAKSLDANADKPALVMVHHNPGLDGHIGLLDTLAFYDIIRPRKHVKAYFFGHTHAWRLEQDQTGIHLVNLPALGYTFENLVNIPVLGYTFQKGVPCGWVYATLQPEGMKLELRCTNPKHPAQGQVVQLKWRV